MSAPYTPPRSTTERILRELPIAIGLATGVMALAGWSPPGTPGSASSLLWSGWLVAAVLACSFRAMAHADVLAERFGEPYGTLILTISAITIEVAAVCAVMLGSQGDASVARDTMFSVLMIVLNLVGGIVMLLAGLGRREQTFNEQSAAAFLPFVMTLGVVTLVLPRFTTSAPGGWMSTPMEVFVGLTSFVIYGSFLYMQTTRASGFFVHAGADARQHEGPGHGDPSHGTPDHGERLPRSTLPPAWESTLLLVLSLLAVVLIAKGLTGRVATLLDALQLPPAIGGVFIAALVLAPESLAAIAAARSKDMQRAVNILLGTSLSTIGLTAPAIIAIRFVTGASPEMGLDPPFITLLVTTFIVASVNYTRGRLNAMQGFVHIVLFLAWIVTIFDESSAR